jgi:uncharacterized membrane protein
LEEQSMAEQLDIDVERPQFRPFTLGDAMILLLALSLGLALARAGIVFLWNYIRSVPLVQFRTLVVALALLRTFNTLLLDFLFFLLPAFLILRLKRPRAPLRSLILQPGFAACAAVLAVFIASLPFVLLAPAGLAGQVIEIGGQILLVVAVPLVWVTLIVTHWWNPEPSWIDRLGRILGVLWMVCVPAHFVFIRSGY